MSLAKKKAPKTADDEVHLKLLRIPARLHNELKELIETRYQGMSMSGVILMQLNQLVRENKRD
jgi:hypothetical protein